MRAWIRNWRGVQPKTCSKRMKWKGEIVTASATARTVGGRSRCDRSSARSVHRRRNMSWSRVVTGRARADHASLRLARRSVAPMPLLRREPFDSAADVPLVAEGVAHHAAALAAGGVGRRTPERRPGLPGTRDQDVGVVHEACGSRRPCPPRSPARSTYRRSITSKVPPLLPSEPAPHAGGAAPKRGASRHDPSGGGLQLRARIPDHRPRASGRMLHEEHGLAFDPVRLRPFDPEDLARIRHLNRLPDAVAR